jgi:hypothetical protein
MEIIKRAGRLTGPFLLGCEDVFKEVRDIMVGTQDQDIYDRDIQLNQSGCLHLQKDTFCMCRKILMGFLLGLAFIHSVQSQPSLTTSITNSVPVFPIGEKP